MYKVNQKKTLSEKFKNKKMKEQDKEDHADGDVFNLNSLLERKMKEAGSIHKMKTINYSFFSIFKNNLQRYCPLRLQVCCLRQSVKDRLFQSSYKKFRKEIEITNLLKTIRILKAGLQTKFTP